MKPLSLLPPFMESFTFCPQECLKPVFASEQAEAVAAAKHTLYQVLDVGLRLLSPFMPYITEELYQRLPHPSSAHRAVSVAVAPFPQQVWMIEATRYNLLEQSRKRRNCFLFLIVHSSQLASKFHLNHPFITKAVEANLFQCITYFCRPPRYTKAFPQIICEKPHISTLLINIWQFGLQVFLCILTHIASHVEDIQRYLSYYSRSDDHLISSP